MPMRRLTALGRAATLHVRRAKNGKPSAHPLRSDVGGERPAALGGKDEGRVRELPPQLAQGAHLVGAWPRRVLKPVSFASHPNLIARSPKGRRRNPALLAW
jgi:hypothetical protein